MHTGAIKILVAEDDQNLSFLLKKNLAEEGFEIIVATDGQEAWSSFTEQSPDLCILDVMMPKQDGFTLAQMIRGLNKKVPILFLTARTLKEDLYRGFESGADDYITKPFTAKELLLRIQAILKRTGRVPVQDEAANFTLGKYVFDYITRQLVYEGVPKQLSTKENELMRIFCENINVVINRDRLLTEVWGKDDYFVSKSLDVYITKLRKLLINDPGINIQNYHSIGYKMIVKPQIS